MEGRGRAADRRSRHRERHPRAARHHHDRAVRPLRAGLGVARRRRRQQRSEVLRPRGPAVGHRPRVSAHRRRAACGREDRTASPDRRALRRPPRPESSPASRRPVESEPRAVERHDGRALSERHAGVAVRARQPGAPAAIAKSKFKDIARFGTLQNGFILLQDHGDRVWFRNVKIRRLPSRERHCSCRRCQGLPGGRQRRRTVESTSPSTANRSRRTSTLTRSRSRCCSRSARRAARW